MTKKKKPNERQKAWIEARKRHRLSHAHVQMARELGMNPKKLGKIDNHDQEPWKMPLRQFIEHLYFKRFGKERPDTVLSIEDKIRKDEEKRRLRREAKLEARKMGSVPMMSQRSHGGNRDFTSLDEMIEDITVDTYGDDEKFWAFLQAFADHIELPVDGFVIGEPVSVIEIDYDGNERRGITAKCKREDGSEHVIAIYEVVFPEKSKASRYIAAYRRWLNLDPFPTEAQAPSRSKRQHKATADDLDLSRPVELVALSVKQRAARCRLLGSDRVITLRASGLWDVVPGMIVTIKPHKQWRYSGHPYLSGEIQTTRLDVAELNLIPLGLEDKGIWDPETHYWGEEDEPIEQWAKPIIAYGPRPKFEMEQVLPGVNPDDPFDDPFNDPITRSNDLKDAGKRAEAEEILMELCQTDLRCLDAHSHLGNLAFDHRPQDAIRHYEVGLRIGELSLSPDFDGVLPWGHIDNRPFLRNMHGYGLCLWRLGRFDLAEHIFDRMLWLNPSDNQGIRFLIDDVRERIAWEDRVNE